MLLLLSPMQVLVYNASFIICAYVVCITISAIWSSQHSLQWEEDCLNVFLLINTCSTIAQISCKMIVQKWQFRKTRPDSHNADAVFRYIWEYSVCLCSEWMFVCLDDKHRIKIGEPGLPVAAAGWGRCVMVSLDKEFNVGGHVFTKFSLIPSVSLNNENSSSIGHGISCEAHVDLKDANFEPSFGPSQTCNWTSLAFDKKNSLKISHFPLFWWWTWPSVDVCIGPFPNLDVDLLCLH